MAMTSILSSIRWEEKPMLMAVSCLSPVNTHTFMPASFKLSMASGTPSCRRSSIPVAPKCSKREGGREREEGQI